MYDNLKFFKGFDHSLNLVKNENEVWEGNIFLEEVSVDLYETVNIFLLEEVAYYSGNPNQFQKAFVKPIQSSTNSSLLCKWIDEVDSSHDIIIFDAKIENGKPIVFENKNLELNLQDISIPHNLNDLRLYEEDDFKKLSNEALQINIALKSNKEGTHRRVLGIYSVDNGEKTLIAKISFYGEVVGEDERLKILLENLGASLNEGDFLLFKEHNILEQSPDYKLLNRKRKELLLELHNIKPFTGTYKAILNAINFFGYTKLEFKEYWINVDNTKPSFGKLYAIPVSDSVIKNASSRKKENVITPSSTMKKTSRFSLVYRLNQKTGNNDIWGIPTVNPVFDFTPEEILIKLYGLKQKLQKEFLPLNARIIDITAEGDFFTQKSINVWDIQNTIGHFREGHNIKFKIIPDKTLFIEDMALVLGASLDQESNEYNTFINLKPDEYQYLTPVQIKEFINIFTEFYNSYNELDLKTFNKDIPVACPIILDGSPSFKDTWDDAKFPWNYFIDTDKTIDNWFKEWVYEIEWIVNGPNNFTFTIRGDIENYLKIPLIVPYSGNYDIEMRTYDLFGHRSHRKIKDFFNVNLKDIELYGVYRWLEDTSWNDKILEWNKSGGYWDRAQDNSLIVDDAIASLYLTLDRANYVHDESQGIRFSTVRRYKDIFSKTGFSETTGPYIWDECRFRWNDTKHNWWDATRVGSDLKASFKVHEIENGDIIEIEFKDPITDEILIGQHTITSPTPTASPNTQAYEDQWNAIRDELNNSNDFIISKFNWNPVFEDLDNDGVADVFLYMLAVGKRYSKNNDFEKITVIPNNSSNIFVDGEQHVVQYNFGFDDTKMFRSYAEVERSTHVTIASDLTRMPGIKNPKWTIINKTNEKINDIYYDSMWLTYIFQDPGTYEIMLEVEDTNGNHNTVKRNMINVK